MGKLRDLLLAAIDKVRLRLPASAVEAVAEDGAVWVTPTAAVIVERRGVELLVQAYSAQLDKTVGPAVAFQPNSLAEDVVAAIAMRILGTWPSQPQIVVINRPAGGAVCGARSRTGIDPGVRATQQRAETLLYFLRDNTGRLASVENEDELAMVQRYLLYLSMLVDTALSGMAMLAHHGLDRGVVVFQRLLAEYAVRARYALRHPRYTLWTMTIAEADDFLKRLVRGGGAEDAVAAATAAVEEMQKRFPTLGNEAKDARLEQTLAPNDIEDVATTEQHVSLYRWPSIFIHGDPIGMRELFRVTPDGKMQGVIHLDDETFNGDLVDATSMLVEFLRAFADGFLDLKNSDSAVSQLAQIEREIMVHSLRFPKQRRADYIAHARRELGLESA